MLGFNIIIRALLDSTPFRQLTRTPDGFNTMPDHGKAFMPNTGWDAMTVLSFASGIMLSFLSAFITYVNFIKLQWGTLANLVVGSGIALSLFGALVAYINLVKVYRYRNVKRLMTKYGYNNDFKSYEHMTVEIAQEIYFNLARYDMPFLFEFGWILNFLKTATAPVLSDVIVKTGHFTSKDQTLSHARQQDTVCLMTAMQAMPFHTMPHSLVIARINAHHNLYGGQINSDTMLWLSHMWMQGPIRWINQFGWRPLMQWEKWALFIMWRELSVMLGCKWVPQDLAAFDEFEKSFVKIEQRPDPVNVIFSDSMVDAILFSIPSILKPFARRCVIAIMDEDVRYCNMYDNEFDPKLRTRIFGLLNLWRLFQKHLCMPRGHGRALTPSGPNANGKWNFPPYTFPATPLYVKKTFWNQWGLIAIVNRLRGLPIPGSQFYSDGVSLESMGAKRKSPTTQAQVETRVRDQAELINKSSWGYRAKVNFQAWPVVVKDLGTGYGFPQNAYSKTARTDTKEMNEAPSKSPAPLADGSIVEQSRTD